MQSLINLEHEMLATTLIIEDDPARQRRLLSWMPDGYRSVTAESAGKALALLSKKYVDEYAAIVLDHDLQQQTIIPEDRQMSGTTLVGAIITNVPRWVPILIQSVNVSRGPEMRTRLKKAGFSVEFIPMPTLTAEVFEPWVREAVELWDDMQ